MIYFRIKKWEMQLFFPSFSNLSVISNDIGFLARNIWLYCRKKKLRLWVVHRKIEKTGDF